MKHYDKILFIIALVACLGGVGVYLGVKPSANAIKLSTLPLKGTEVTPWKDEAPKIPEMRNWSAPDFDLATGWNYDLFGSPETTWLTSDKIYIAKELPPPVDDPFGVKLISMSVPKFRLRISTVSSDVPPATVKDENGKTKRGAYRVVAKFESISGESSSVDFSRLQSKLEKQEIDGRTIVTLTLRKPVALRGQNAELKSFCIVKGKSESNDGTSYTRYMATIIDLDDKKAEVKVVEEWVSKANCVEAVFQDVDSTRQWLYKQRIVDGSDKPQVELLSRESANDAFAPEGTEPSFKKDSATYFVKGLDISTQEATITKQSESNRKAKRPKIRLQVLTPEK